MPTYQYRCTDCGHDLEAVQRFSDAALTECPACGGSLRKVYNAVGVVFKGSGFYRTDSRKGAGDGGGTKDGGDTAAPAAAKGGDGASSNGSGAAAGAGTSGGADGVKAASNTPATGSGSTSSTGAKAAAK